VLSSRTKPGTPTGPQPGSTHHVSSIYLVAAREFTLAPACRLPNRFDIRPNPSPKCRKACARGSHEVWRISSNAFNITHIRVLYYFGQVWRDDCFSRADFGAMAKASGEEESVIRYGRTLLTFVTAGLAIGAMPAFGDQINIVGSTQTMGICSTGGGTVVVAPTAMFSSMVTCAIKPSPTIANETIGDGASFSSPTGNPIFGGSYNLIFTTALDVTAGLTITTGPTTFLYKVPAANGGGTVTGSVVWAGVTDSSGKFNVPQFTGTFTVTSDTSGNAIVAADFPKTQTAELDFTLNNVTHNIAFMLTHKGFETAKISSGQVTPLPEPGTPVLLTAQLGLGLLALAFRRRLAGLFS
jgi:hypothetical protein